jgi:hypothetical protein
MMPTPHLIVVRAYKQGEDVDTCLQHWDLDHHFSLTLLDFLQRILHATAVLSLSYVPPWKKQIRQWSRTITPVIAPNRQMGVCSRHIKVPLLTVEICEY